jgi:hypothetical protein
MAYFIQSQQQVITRISLRISQPAAPCFYSRTFSNARR